jgi:hypothetical protein
LKKEEVTVFFRRKMMAFNWKDKRDVFKLSSIPHEEVQTVCDKKGWRKAKIKVVH